MREGLECLFWRTWKVHLLGAIWGILQHLRRFGVTGRINIVEVSMYAGRLGEVSFFGAPGRYAYWAPYGVFSSTCAALAYWGA